MTKAKLLETIKCHDGSVFNLDYHQNRVNTSRSQLGYTGRLELRLSPPEHGLYRCRIIYAKEIEKIEYLPYQLKKTQSFKLLESNINYDLKYENRDELNALVEKREEADEIIIIKNGLVTDTSIANLCFFDGRQWLTPKTPLLEGTTRQRYLDAGRIVPADIYAKNIAKYPKIAMLNAMVDFYLIEDAIIL